MVAMSYHRARSPVLRLNVPNAAVAEGLPLMPLKQHTDMIWPGALVKLLSVMTKRLKLLILVGMKDILALVDAPAA